MAETVKSGRGGRRPGAGRKKISPFTQEQQATAMQKLQEAVAAGESWAITFVMSKLVGMFICNGVREIGVSEDGPYASASSYGCLSQIEEVMPDGRVLIRKYDVTVDVSREEITAHLFRNSLGTYQVVTLPDNVGVVNPAQAVEPIVGTLAKTAVKVLGGRICSSLRSDVAAGLGGVISSGETDDIRYTFVLTPGNIDW